jgi:plastocyanin/sugar lactone lactonase YvrE
MSNNRTTILLLTTLIVMATIGIVSGNPNAMEKNKIWNVIAGGQTKDMAIQGMAFYPGIIIINVGDTIKWKIGGNFHTISFLSGQVPPPAGSPESLTPSGSSEYNGTGFVSSGILPTGANYSLKFTEPGVFSYICLIHSGMQGIVIVQPSGSKYPFTQKEYNNQGETDLQKDIDVGRELSNQVKHMVTSSQGPDNTTMWKIFIDIPSPEIVKLNIKHMNSSHVKGKATLDMTSPVVLNVKIDVTGLEPNSNNPSNIKIGTCDMPGSTAFSLGNIKADSNGKASFMTDINVSPGFGIMNRGWIVSIDKNGASVACGNVVKHDAAYMRFTPGKLTINQGDNVMWTQLDAMEIHTVSFLAAGQTPPDLLLPGYIINPEIAALSGVDGYNGSGFYNSGILIPGATYNLTFTRPGMYDYLCLIHDEMKMMGKVVVLPPGGSISGIKTVVDFNATASEAPENLAVDSHGNIYVSMALTGEIKKVTPEGKVSTFAKLPSPGTGFMTGITFDKSENLYVAFASFDSNHGIWRVSKDGKEKEVFAALTVNGQPDGLPNDLKFDKKGNLYVSDFIGGKVWKIDRKGIVSIWKIDPLLMGVVVPGLGPISNFPIGANGLAFDQNEKNLYVSNTGLGRIIRIPVEDDGNAGDAEVFVEDEHLLKGADGINFDKDGKLYVAVNFQDRIVIISQKGDTATLAEGNPLQNPADVLFGVRDQENNLYIANFAIFRFLGVVKETPKPALLKMPVYKSDMDEHDWMRLNKQ